MELRFIARPTSRTRSRVLTGLRLGIGRALRGDGRRRTVHLLRSPRAVPHQQRIEHRDWKLIAGITFLSILGVVVLQATRMVELRLLAYRATQV